MHEQGQGAGAPGDLPAAVLAADRRALPYDPLQRRPGANRALPDAPADGYRAGAAAGHGAAGGAALDVARADRARHDGGPGARPGRQSAPGPRRRLDDAPARPRSAQPALPAPP